ncbi:MAG: hypothetical protein RLZZ324_834 [Candidatus Parcubacteria bacterium]|jgi:hypothetical protein
MDETIETGQLMATVADAIKERKLQPLPRWHFALRGALIGTGVVLLALALVFVASLIVFLAHLNGAWFAPSFGYAGLRTLVFSLPWMLVLLALLFTVLLEALVKRYAFAYRQPLFYSAVGIVVIAAVGGYAVSVTPLHPSMYIAGRDHQSLVAERFYAAFAAHDLDDVHPGVIIDLNDGGFTLRDRQDETLSIIVTPDTRFPYGTALAPDDVVVVFGDRQGDTVAAQGVRRIEDVTLRHRGRPGSMRTRDMHRGRPGTIIQ